MDGMKHGSTAALSAHKVLFSQSKAITGHLTL